MITKKYLQQELAKRIDGYKRGVETSTDNIIAEMKSILVLVDALPDYEKKYNEALEDMRVIYPNLKGDAKLAVEHAFPEIREIEDESIRKAIVATIEQCPDDFLNPKNRDRMLAWLEKQKEQKPNIELIQRSWYMEGYHDREFGKEPKWIIKTGEGGPKHELNPKYGQSLAENPKEQKPVKKQDYSGLNDLERAIHRGFLSAGVENVPVTIIKETARECLAQMNPAEWNDTDMKEARNNLISVCRDWECGKQTALLHIAAVRARYFLEHLTEPKPAEWSEEDERRIDAICELLENTSAIHPNNSHRKLIIWLKSLRPQPKQEWSGEDEKVYNNALDALYYKDVDDVLSALKDLCDLISRKRKVIPPYSRWKPSDEQMKALDKAITVCMGVVGRDEIAPLESLYEQLKKL